MPIAGAVIAGAVAGGVAGGVAGSMTDRAIDEVTNVNTTVNASGDVVFKGLATAAEPSIVTIDMPTAGTEYELRVPSSCKKFMLQTRDGTTFKVATESGGTAAKVGHYFTVKANSVIWWDGLNVTAPKEAVLYVACAVANKTAEIWQWS